MRSFFRIAGLVVAIACAWLLPVRRAWGACERGPSPPRDVVVHVQSRSDWSLGVVVGARDLVLVPAGVVSLDHPGGPDARIVDAGGNTHAATLVALDRTAGLALVRADAPLALTALDVHPAESTPEGPDPVDVECIYSLQSDDEPWTWTRFDDDAQLAPFKTRARTPAYFTYGAPLVDEDGRVVALVGTSGWDQKVRLDGSAVRRLFETGSAGVATRNAFTLHMGVGLQTEFATKGGLWIGGYFAGVVRYRDVAELRLDASYLLLVPKPGTAGGCVEGCAAGLRGTLTPSVGPRIELLRRGALWRLVVTPSIGLALGVQDTTAGQATAFDTNHPSTYALAAPGLAIAFGPIDIHSRVRLPRGDVTAATWEIGAGATF